MRSPFLLIIFFSTHLLSHGQDKICQTKEWNTGDINISEVLNASIKPTSLSYKKAICNCLDQKVSKDTLKRLVEGFEKYYSPNTTDINHIVYAKSTIGQLDLEGFEALKELPPKDVFFENHLAYLKELCKQKKKQEITNVEQIKAYLDWKSHFQIDSMLFSKKFSNCVTFDCDYVHYILEPDFDHSSISKAKIIYSLMNLGKCTSDPLFIEVTQMILEKEPNPGGLAKLTYAYVERKEYKKALSTLDKMYAFLRTKEDSASFILRKAQIEAKANMKIEARDDAMFALSLDSSLKSNVHGLIGDLYASSEAQCKSDTSAISSLVYVAAYEEYNLANNEAKMAEVKLKFPKKELLFVYQMKEGDKRKLNCWIDKEVTVKAK